MPLVAHNRLPTFQRLKEGGEVVLSLDRATKQDIRELHIGFLNMMPDAALTATESQFIRFIGACNQIAQIYVYPFSIPELNRNEKAEAHIAEHYFEFETLQEQGLDALIITGANVSNPILEEEAFWDPLMRVISWADENVASVLCSCLATHAVVKHIHGIDRSRMGRKKWGVYSHHIANPGHPLMRDVNTRFDAPHSRYNEVTKEQLEDAGLTVLVEGEDAGVHLAVSPDQFRMVYFQGHPEYDAVSLLKEYKREVMRFFAGERDNSPRYPENYMPAPAQEVAKTYFRRAEKAIEAGDPLPPFPDAELETLVDNTWGDTGKAIVNNWLGLVYGLTSVDRHEQFMSSVDPADPLSLRI
ncbi:MAG: homoserine O-succinyltransferase [Woeseiaceae bacterium]|nr:homoserine O-succinyltransferase [Woeseiaceae bacterium]